jgi:multidrug efflux pump subunit AcrA (membrane-fusion protein)
MQRKQWYTIFLLLNFPGFTACVSKEIENEESALAASTPVTAEQVSTNPMTEYVELNATSFFLQKSYVKSSVNGYLLSASTRLGLYVKKGQGLFSVRTKESQSIGNTLTQLDSTFKFSGITSIQASESGLHHRAQPSERGLCTGR